MTLEELAAQMDRALWFSRLGQYTPAPGQLTIQTLEAWVDEESRCDRHHQKIAEGMEWLPAQAQDPDPIHADRLPPDERALVVYKQALASLRPVAANERLKIGPHDFQHVAHGAAAYACRRAALEIVHGQPGFWCALVPLYAAGHWPCGLMPDQTLVIY